MTPPFTASPHRLLDDPGCAGGGRGGDALLRDQGGSRGRSGHLRDDDPGIGPLRGVPRPGRGERSWGAAGVLAVNVSLLLLSGSLTLAVQTALASAAEPPPEPRHQKTTCTTTVRSRGRSSKSISTSCCQVPSARRPPTTRDLLGGPDQRGALVGVGVGVVIEAVVLVVALGRDEPVEQVPQVGDAAGLELHRRDCGGGPTDEGGDQSIVHGSRGHDPLDVGGDVDDVRVPLSRLARLPAVNGHALTLANEDRFSPESGDAASANS